MLVAFHLSRVSACIFSIVVLRLPSVLPVAWQLEQAVPFISIVAFTLKECPFTFWLSGNTLPFESFIIVAMWQSMHSKFICDCLNEPTNISFAGKPCTPVGLPPEPFQPGPSLPILIFEWQLPHSSIVFGIMV